MFGKRSHKKSEQNKKQEKKLKAQTERRRALEFRQPICMLDGTHELQIENYGSIGSFTEEKIVLFWKKGKIIVEGEHLLIAYYTDIDMKITGRIRRIEL